MLAEAVLTSGGVAVFASRSYRGLALLGRRRPAPGGTGAAGGAGGLVTGLVGRAGDGRYTRSRAASGLWRCRLGLLAGLADHCEHAGESRGSGVG